MFQYFCVAHSTELLIDFFIFQLGNSVFGFDVVGAISSDPSEIIYLLGWTELEMPAVLSCSFAHAQPPQCCSQGQQPDGAFMDGLGR